MRMAQDKNPKPTEEDVKRTPAENQSVDRDGRERQPNEQTDEK